MKTTKVKSKTEDVAKKTTTWKKEWSESRKKRYAEREDLQKAALMRANAYRKAKQEEELAKLRKDWLHKHKAVSKAWGTVLDPKEYARVEECTGHNQSGEAVKKKLWAISPHDLGVNLGLSFYTLTTATRKHNVKPPSILIGNHKGKPTRFYSLEEAKMILQTLQTHYLTKSRHLDKELLENLNSNLLTVC
jgi:hypothetical protein